MYQKLLSTTFIILFITGPVFVLRSQDYYTKEREILDNIARLIKECDCERLARYFNPMLELSLPDNENGIYSKTQAKFLIRDFCRKHQHAQISFEKREENAGDSIYGILLYETGIENYTVYYQLRKTKDLYKIHTFQIIKKPN